MTICTGAPAELHALQYVEGTLSEFEVERFEEHYFDCPVCLARLQALQVVGREFARQPVAQAPRPKLLLAWPVRVWTAGAVAALLLMSVLIYKNLVSRPAQPTVAQSQPKSAPQPESPAQPVRSSAAPVHLSQLADLTLPAYFASNLRGARLDARFEAGMKEYANGNCRGAIAALSQLSAESAEARAAEFYSGACQMRLGDFASATVVLRKVADAGDSPQQEAALYELAQIALASNDSATAHAYLLRAISLRGDLERRCRMEDKQVMDLIGQNHLTEGKNPETK
jgi:TolA-binding protein